MVLKFQFEPTRKNEKDTNVSSFITQSTYLEINFLKFSKICKGINYYLKIIFVERKWELKNAQWWSVFHFWCISKSSLGKKSSPLKERIDLVWPEFSLLTFERSHHLKEFFHLWLTKRKWTIFFSNVFSYLTIGVNCNNLYKYRNCKW